MSFVTLQNAYMHEKLHNKLKKKEKTISGEPLDFDDAKTIQLYSQEFVDFWIKIIKIEYGKNSGIISVLNICVVIPLDNQSTNNTTDIDLVNTLNNIKYDEIPNEVSQTSIHGSNAEIQMIKEFKLKLYERKSPYIIKFLNCGLIVLTLILFGSSSNVLFNDHSITFYLSN